jgi:predicted DNA-binding transcriptional regulator AlpA
MRKDQDNIETTDGREIVQSRGFRRMAGDISKSAFYRLESGLRPSAGRFPKAFKLGSMKQKFYLVAEIKDWIAAQIEATE